MKELLILATAALKQEQWSDTMHEHYPRVEYVELAKRIDADILNYSLYESLAWGHHLQRLETFLRSDVTLALAGLQAAREHQTVLAMSERVGIPLSFLKKLGLLGTPLVFRFTAWSERQRWVFQRLRLLSAVDRIITMNSAFGEMLCKEFRVPKEKVDLALFSVDHLFFRPMGDGGTGRIFSAGEVRGRDYPTLLDAVQPLEGIHLHIAASGTWYAREKEPLLRVRVPANVSIGGRYSLSEMKDLYARSTLVVVPLHDVIFPAGVTVVLEAMAMGKAVIASKSMGIMDYIVDGETGILVEPGNAQVMREAIEYLLANPREAKHLGENGRQRIEEELNLGVYVDRLAQIIRRVLDQAE